MTDKQNDDRCSVTGRTRKEGCTMHNLQCAYPLCFPVAAPTPPNTITITVDEYEMLKKDAERYRWLSEQNADLIHDTFVVLGHDSTVEEQWQKYWVGSDLDEAIDKAKNEKV